ncbi:serine hydrolase domain-containing protein [Lactobacillus agrestimuris]|uniref:serine hydrolase domain-containing protein n=1 Tax=Lactobacillus agrestimuris TaxID=2941328 RepID=UPI003B9737B9
MRKNKRAMKLLCLISASLIGLENIAAGTQSAHAETTSSKSMSSYVKKTLKQYHLRGTVLVVKDGKAQKISSGYGYYRRKIKNGSTKLVYPVGSLQKVVTGALITQLISKKKFSQNTKISRWYPHLKGASHITVGQLMTHTSGINIGGTESNHGVDFSEAGAINWTVKQINSQSATKRGSFNYNNANYILLAGIIRKVTGKSYASNVKNKVIKPLHLKQTYIYDHIPAKKTDAISYSYRGGKDYQNPVYANKNVISQLPGAGDLLSSPSDYFKIQKGLINGKLLTAKQFDYMTHLKSKDSTYSGGIYLKKSGELKLVYGNFGDTHFANWVQLTSDNQNGIVMFLNQTRDSKSQNKAAGYKILNHIKKDTFIK